MDSLTVQSKFQEYARFCLFQILKHHGESSGVRLESLPDSLNTISQLEKVIEQYGYSVQKTEVSWNQLLQEDFPVIIQYQNEAPVLVKAVQGNTVLIDTPQGESKYIPDDWTSNPDLQVLKINKLVPSNNDIHLFTLDWYVHLFKTHWMITIQMVMASMMVQLFAIGMPVLYMVIFDRVFGRQNLDTLNVMAVGMLLILITDFAVKQLRSYVLANQMEAVDKLTIQAFLKEIAHLPLSLLNQQKARSFTDKFAQLPQVNEAITSMLLVSSLDVIFSVIIVILLLLLHFQLAFIALAPLIPMAVLAFWHAPKVKARAMETGKSHRHYRLKLAELIENAETVKSANASTQLKHSILDQVDKANAEGFGTRFDQTSTGNMQGAIAQAGMLITLYFGAKFVLAGEISFGVYIAINMLSKHIMGVVQKLFMTMSKFQESLGTLNEMNEVFVEIGRANQKTEGIRPDTLKGQISINNLRFKYTDNQDWVLKDINLSIAPGEKIVLTGQSGAGKTTLVRLLQKLYSPNQGFIKCDNYNLTDFDEEHLRGLVGVAVQKPSLFAGTLGDNIALSNPYASKQKILDAASFVNLDQYLAHSELGLDTPINPMGSNLSGGQSACVALARVLLQNPDILILDEALAPVDPSTKAIIYSRLFEMYKHKTVIFITDFLPVHQRADRILVMDQGRIIEEGTFETLVKQQGYYALYHRPVAIRRPNQ